MSRNRTSTLTFVGSSDCDSPPRERGPVVERILAKKYSGHFEGLETWEDPTPRPSPFTFEDLRDAFVAGSKRQWLLRPKLPSREELIRRREEHDRKSLVIALHAYAKQKNMQSTELEFVEVKERNLVDELGRGYVHFNFLVKGSDGTFTLFFAEVHPDCREEEDIYLCCPLEESDSGLCFGCNDRAKDLRHPTTASYLGGHKDVGFPFVELDSDGESDCYYL